MAGFYKESHPSAIPNDKVTCYSCGITLCDWNPGDCPFKKHYTHMPLHGCSHLTSFYNVNHQPPPHECRNCQHVDNDDDDDDDDDDDGDSEPAATEVREYSPNRELSLPEPQDFECLQKRPHQNRK